MRQKLEEEEKLRKAAERRAQDLEVQRQQFEQQQRPASPTQEDDWGLEPDGYVEAKHLKKTASQLRNQTSATEKQVHQLEQRLAYFEAKSQMDQIKDFNEVVNDENLSTFAKLYPRDYNTMLKNPDLAEKSVTAYNMIKNYGIYSKRLHDADKKIEQNMSKPASSNTVAPQQPSTPLTRVGDYERRVLSEADKDRINRQLEEKRSRY
jgi:hypothetical protein